MDTSYHGGVLLGGSDVEPEYISAYKERKESRRQSRTGGAAETARMWMEEDAAWMEEEDDTDINNYGDTDPAEGDEDEDSAVSSEQEAAEAVLLEEGGPGFIGSEHGSVTA